MLMNEVFNSTVPISWTEDDRIAEGIFSVNDLTFKIKLERSEYIFKDKVYTYVNVGFKRKDNEGGWTDALIGDNAFTPKIYGAIVNGVNSKIVGAPLAALVFIAQDNVEKRMKFYNRILDYVSRANFPGEIYDIGLGVGRKCSMILSKEFHNREILDDFKKYLAGLDK